MLARHANPRVTLAVYAGLTDGAREVAVDKLLSAGFGRLGAQGVRVSDESRDSFGCTRKHGERVREGTARTRLANASNSSSSMMEIPRLSPEYAPVVEYAKARASVRRGFAQRPKVDRLVTCLHLEDCSMSVVATDEQLLIDGRVRAMGSRQHDVVVPDLKEDADKILGVEGVGAHEEPELRLARAARASYPSACRTGGLTAAVPASRESRGSSYCARPTPEQLQQVPLPRAPSPAPTSLA